MKKNRLLQKMNSRRTVLLAAGILVLTQLAASICQNQAERDGTEDFVRAFTSVGPGTQSYTEGEPYNEKQWGFLNNGLFRLIDDKGTALLQNLSGKKGGASQGPEREGAGTIYAKPGMDIDLMPAREAYAAKSEKNQVVVAVIDTGIQLNHEDLSGAIWVNEDEIPGDAVDNDKNGFVDDVNGWNFYSGNSHLYTGTEDNHGTHSAGTIAAEKNGKGITGICDPAYVKIMPVKVLGTEEGIGTPENVAKAIRYAEANGASICNLSFGTVKFNQELYDTMKNSNMLFVVAAGNGDKSGTGMNIDENPIYPASFDLDNIISVASMRLDGNLDPSSNYGEKNVDLAAPGKYILSTISGNQYAYMSGTSMAAPMVSGTAAMIKSAYPGLETGKIREIILSSSRKNSAMEGKVHTGGMLDAGKAMETAAGV